MNGNLAVINTDDYAAMAKMMGIAYDTDSESKSSLARFKVNKKPLHGETELNGKIVKAEILSGGFELQNGTTVYSETAVLRPFIQRFMYQKYDPNNNNYIKTLMADSFNIDLKDTNGGFNCGKPSGWIEDFDALPQETKDLLRSIKRTRVVYGVVTMSDAITESGDSHPVKDIPCIWDVDTKEGFKNMGSVFSKLNRMKRLPMLHNINLTTAKRDLPTGNSYFVPVPELDMKSSIEIGDDDQQLFTSFMENIESHNAYVLSEWNKHNKPDVEGFVDVSDVEDA
tara:strand:- start:1003 stop:1851 length:849 start_codon:yes stop_codon:yes gene_type:complete